jgi:hypothetical protein
MLPFCDGNAILKSLVDGPNKRDTLNEDYALYLLTSPASKRAGWPLRPRLSSFRNTPKARMAARDYENALIAMWENSPHLLDDIGVVVAPGREILEGQVAAPDRVIEHVLARTAEKAPAVAARLRPEPAAITARPAPKIRAILPRLAPQSGLPA